MIYHSVGSFVSHCSSVSPLGGPCRVWSSCADWWITHSHQVCAPSLHLWYYCQLACGVVGRSTWFSCPTWNWTSYWWFDSAACPPVCCHRLAWCLRPNHRLNPPTTRRPTDRYPYSLWRTLLVVWSTCGWCWTLLGPFSLLTPHRLSIPLCIPLSLSTCPSGSKTLHHLSLVDHRLPICYSGWFAHFC